MNCKVAGLIIAICCLAAPVLAEEALVTRERVRLNLAGAELIVAAAKTQAASMKLNVNIAIVDDGGHLLAFARMDNARPASAGTALTKAVAAATTRVATGPVRRGDAEPDLLLNLSLQNAAAAGGTKMTSLLGGVPIVVDGQVIGAVGVGGGTGEQDAEVAKAGIDKLLTELARQKQ
ncbi:GlcG/HbpS family heme-binding protein [Anatilimnocola floriformis]|uniref:GlcG/HbpS family heme-binding protein n=1 Tax=Anatilimnocola floriformis TaxID=2948575 RepID=UPI0020C59C00|nr:heme-binding protein [Anatilimnocola floriformis]